MLLFVTLSNSIIHMHVQFNLFTYYAHLFGLKNLIEYTIKQFRAVIAPVGLNTQSFQ